MALFFAAWLCWRRWPRRRPRLQAARVGGSQIGREILTTTLSIVIIGNAVPLLFYLCFGDHWLGSWINTSVVHNTHHAKARYNYRWYFLFWDRMMGTLEPHYAENYRFRATGIVGKG